HDVMRRDVVVLEHHELTRRNGGRVRRERQLAPLSGDRDGDRRGVAAAGRRRLGASAAPATAAPCHQRARDSQRDCRTSFFHCLPPEWDPNDRMNGKRRTLPYRRDLFGISATSGAIVTSCVKRLTSPD